MVDYRVLSTWRWWQEGKNWHAWVEEANGDVHIEGPFFQPGIEHLDPALWLTAD